MTNYHRMNKIHDEQKVSERARAEEDSYAEHEKDLFIQDLENKGYFD